MSFILCSYACAASLNKTSLAHFMSQVSRAALMKYLTSRKYIKTPPKESVDVQLFSKRNKAIRGLL